MTIGDMTKEGYFCPRCGNLDIIDYDDTFDCPKCMLEFNKEDFDIVEDKSNVLSIQEKMAFIEVLELDEIKLKKLFKEDHDD